MSWHKPVRVALGVFGVASAVVVYLAIGSRPAAAPPAVIERLDPKAVLESTGALLQQVRKSEEDYEVKADRTLTYEDGSARLFGVQITVRKRNGRDFVVTAREAGAGKDRKDLALTGDVVLKASDGFALSTADATYREEDGFVRAPGRVAFTKGGLRGSGLGMTYDQNTDVLSLLAEPDVTMAGSEALHETSFRSGSAQLDRVMDVLSLTGGARAQRGDEVFEAATITARLSEDEQFVRVIELRSDARVSGAGGALDSMSAQAIDMAYAEGGERLERVTLTDHAAVALAPTGTAAAGRQLLGGALDLRLAPDGSLEHVSGRDGVRFDLPGTDRARASSIQSRTFEAEGRAGAGLTGARFLDDVQYRENATGAGAPRVARSNVLVVALRDDAVGDATFSGGVAFEERGFMACAADLQYDPAAAAIRLSGSDAGGVPRVSDSQVAIAAQSIDVTLQTREMSARGDVRTVLRPPREARASCGGAGAARPAPEGPETGDRDGRLPGLLQQDQPANVNADRLTYSGAGGTATYVGNAMLWQGDTAIRADELRIDQQKGDLVAAGMARSALVLDGRPASGRAEEIRYEDARRLVTYDSRPAAPNQGRAARGAARGARPPAAGRGTGPLTPQAYLSDGPESELRADRIEVRLAAGAARADRMEAYSRVSLKVDTRRATGDRLTYFAEDEKYVMTGTATEPVCVLDSNRATTGKTLVFYRSADNVLVDGNEEIRTQTKSGGPCALAPSR